MKIDVSANDFCPDNCPYCELTSDTILSGNLEYFKRWRCTMAERCKMIREMNNDKGTD